MNVQKLKMMKKNMLAVFLTMVLIVVAVSPGAFAQRRHRRGPSKVTHIAVGTAVGAVGGALIGGKKGALIGAGAGAGTGYIVYRHKKHKRAIKRSN
jgi:osmotically inducible lipoprotein OsmB